MLNALPTEQSACYVMRRGDDVLLRWLIPAGDGSCSLTGFVEMRLSTDDAHELIATLNHEIVKIERLAAGL